ncbi:MAG: hypothetical protein LBE12_18575, partial [Planctomycetaceae bacterium]|nr:hypothetical protein [Planctomycetaceae bacterium]
KDSYEQLRKEVDRYLWTNGRNEELKNPEPEKISNEDNENKKKANNTSQNLVSIILLILGILLVIIGLGLGVLEDIAENFMKVLNRKESKKPLLNSLLNQQESKNPPSPTQIQITPPKENKEKQKEENDQKQENQTPTIPTNQAPLTSPSDSGESVILPSR